jgi:hypothetical protein
MSRLTKAEKADYEEEAEYSDQQGATRTRSPSAYDRIIGATKGIVTATQGALNSPTGRAVRDYAQRMNAPGADNFGGSSSGRPRVQRPAQQPIAGVNPGSSLHPGQRLYVISGSILASGGGQKSPEERRKRRGPGGANPGFGK